MEIKLESYAQQCLKKLCGNEAVQKIPEENTRKTPDLIVKFGGDVIVVEEKDKKDSEDFLKERESKLSGGKLFDFSISQGFDNRLSGLVRDAARQISSDGAPLHDFGIVWFNSAIGASTAKAKQFEYTLYGVSGIISLDANIVVPCYFFGESAFFRNKDTLAGAIIAEISDQSASLRLCLNPYSPNYGEFRNSYFTKLFADHGVMVDPLKEESDGRAYILDADIDRKDEDQLLRHISKKYGIENVSTFNMAFHMTELKI